jgi:hypothetical protein
VLQRLLRRAGYCYKRVRRSLRAKRPPARFAACQRLLRALHRRADQPQVWYTDECRFSRQAPVSHAWQRRGASAVTVPAVRGKGGYSMLGFWCTEAATEAATETPLFRWWTSETAFNATLWLAAVEEWRQTLRRPAVLVLDNASIHTANIIKERRPEWKRNGLTLLYLPSYSPELNRIETLWLRFKHTWLAPADYDSEQSLFCRINEIANGVGTKYRITFG